MSCLISLPIRVTTTNGLEVHGRVIERKTDQKNMSSMLAVLIDGFIHDSN